MQATIIAAALLLGVGQGETIVADDAASAPTEFYAAAPRPYAPSITVYYPSPSYDCYSHHGNLLNCYPSFSERHYRRPYNYRVKFDYPWHEDVYRSWPDACVCDEGGPQFAAETPRMYSGARSNAASNAPTNAMRLRDAPLPPRTLR
ncbi:MAG: hypothetical protein WD875_01885 [Pirellulales bacterium]